MTKDFARGYERAIEDVAREIESGGHVVLALAVRKIGERLLDRDESECVFPAAAALPEKGNEPTVRAKA
jgi:hypothetical protein